MFKNIFAAVALAAACAAMPSPTSAQRADVPPVSPTAPDAGSTDAARIFNETIAEVAVTVGLLGGATRSGKMIVTHFRPPGAGPFPLVVMNHGRSGRERDTPARFRSLQVVRYWVRRGFAIAVPTRLGYGATGTEPDTETSGRSCDDRQFGPMSEGAAHQIRTAIDFAKTLPWVDRDRIIVMGQSVGGLAAVVAGAKATTGVIAVINSAGGSGGEPKGRPEQPCRPDRLGQVYAVAGTTSRVPTLWLYSENDRYWGAKHPRAWHTGFVSSGGKADFIMLPANGEDGHRQIDRLAVWRPHVDRFIAGLGFAIPSTANAPPATGFAAFDDATKLPAVKPGQASEHYPKFLALDLPRAFVIGPTGAFAYRSGDDALGRALAHCQEIGKTACKPYAVDDAVVWGQRGR